MTDLTDSPNSNDADDLLTLLDKAVNELDPAVLVGLIDQLSELGLNRFDPVRFGFIDALKNKMQGQRQSVSVLLFAKLKKALSQLQEELHAAQANADQLLAVVTEEFPAALTQANQYHQQFEFGRLKKLTDDLYRKQLQAPSLFKALIDDLSQLNDGDLASTQISAEVADMTSAASDNGTLDHESHEGGEHGKRGKREEHREFKALTPLRESWAKLNAEKLVMRSINEGPENAGPLNPHYLAIRSLSNMRDLSPHYLNRFVAYMETLLWLETSKLKKSPNKRKKNPKK